MIKKMFDIVNNKYVRKLLLIGFIFTSFYILDISIKMIINDKNYFYYWYHLSSNLFSLSWIILFITIIFTLSDKWNKKFYVFLLVCSSLYYFAQVVHLNTLNRFFSVYDIFLVGEGTSYFLDVITNISLNSLLVIFGSLLILVFTLKVFKNDFSYSNKKERNIILIVGLILFIVIRMGALYKLGDADLSNGYVASTIPRNAYNEFSNPNKTMQVSGMYEKPLRQGYLYIKSLFTNSKMTRIEISKYLIENTKTVNINEYNNIFKDKNLIMIQLESIDSWLVDDMPTLKGLMEEGINFTNYYTPAFGGGQTFNSEFAANTGLYSLNAGKPSYSFDNNLYPYSMANMFKNDGYSTQSLHANYGKYYNRSSIHKAIGYQNHYSLLDMNLNTSVNVFLDSSLSNTEEIYKLIVPDSSKFMSFVITYTPHLPYNNTNEKCNSNQFNVDEDDESLRCVKNLVKDTDLFLSELLKKLTRDNLLNDTVLVLYTDHYAYGYPDSEYLYNVKGTDDHNLLQKNPFIIWSNDIQSNTVDNLMDTADILPTIANMFGLSTYNPSNYLSTDVFSSDHKNYVYFGDSSWYDGNTYFKGLYIDNIDVEYADIITKEVNSTIKMNDEILLSDYYRKK